MKSNTKKIIILLVLGMGFVFLPNIKLDFDQGQKFTVINPKESGFYYETNINIDATATGVGAHNWTWAVSQPWCYGQGTWQEPYIIENVTVDCGGTGSGILIENSDTDYFIIRNCTVYNSGSVWYDAGIKLENTNNGTLTNNNCSNKSENGILLINYCNNNTISGNIACNNTDDGISLYTGCNDNKILGNTANNNTEGIYLRYDCDNNIISGNTACNNTDDGIYLDDYCVNNTISGNTANDNGELGIYLASDCNNNKILGNTASDNLRGIYLRYDSDNNIISGNTANGNADFGIILDQSNNNTISGNNANNNTDFGIDLDQSNNNTISGNSANNHLFGIRLSRSNDTLISGNTANENNIRGIWLYQSNNNTISGNTANNDFSGIYLHNDCDNNTISGNIVNDNDYSGIYLEDYCDNNTISGNIISDNNYGMNIEITSDNNIIHENFFLKNGKHSMDNGTDNKWNSTTIGNYWDNWTSPDTNLDGIVDEQYNISGTAGSIDYLPIAEDGAPSITINSPSDDDVFGTSAPSFSVTITDDFLDKWWYTLDEGLVNYNFTGSTGTIDQSAWDALSDGTIALTFYASDIPGNIRWADVDIVKDTTAPIIVINSPSSEDEFGVMAPAFNIVITDDHLDSIWYSLDGGLTIYAIITNATIDQTAWAALSEGSITITFYANDTLGHETSKDVVITKSWDDPTIVIVVVSIVGGVAVITVVYVFMKKRATPE